MRNWESYVRDRLDLNRLKPGRQERIVRELAQQLEDFCQEGLSQGLTPGEADAYARRQIRDWDRFACEIRRVSRSDARPRTDHWSDLAMSAGRGRGRGWMLLSDLIRDLGFGLRWSRLNPGFFIVAVLTLALGIGANTAIFSIVNGVLLKPLDYPDSERVVTLWSGNDSPVSLSQPELAELRWRQRSFEEIGPFLEWDSGANVTGGAEPYYVNIHPVTPGFFSVLGVKPLIGRVFEEEEVRDGDDRLVVLSHGFWMRQFGGDPSVVGGTLALSGISWKPSPGIKNHRILGVMPEEFEFLMTPDMWSPLRFDPARPGPWAYRDYPIVARLKAGVSLESASEDIRRVMRELVSEFPAAYPEKLAAARPALVVPLLEARTRGIRPSLLVLVASVSLLLVIACANVANLQLSRASSREKEIALRASLGAGRGRIVRQLLTESTMLACLGGAAGFLLAYWSVDALAEFAPVPRSGEIGIDYRVLSYSLLVSLLTGILFGLVPAFQSARKDSSLSLSESGRSSSSRASRRLRDLFAVMQVALSVVLLVGSALLLRTHYNLVHLERGFERENVLTFRIRPPASREDGASSFYKEMLPRVRGLPGVEAAGAISFIHLHRMTPGLRIMPQGLAPNFPEYPVPFGLIRSQVREMTPGYLETMGIDLLRGRAFEASDSSGSPNVVIVDEEFAAQAWPQDPDVLGKRLAIPDLSGGEHEWWTVIGVVQHTEGAAFPEAENPQVYFPAYQTGRSVMHVAIKAAGDPDFLLPLIRRESAAVDPTVALYQIASLEQRFEWTLSRPRFSASLMTLFAGAALSLSLVGLYGVIAYAVSRRTHEIGIRRAFGAKSSDVLAMVMRKVLSLVGIGSVIGLASALGLSRFLSSQLYGVEPSDPLTYLGLTGLLIAVAMAACLAPARGATRVDPLQALRHE